MGYDSFRGNLLIRPVGVLRSGLSPRKRWALGVGPGAHFLCADLGLAKRLFELPFRYQQKKITPHTSLRRTDDLKHPQLELSIAKKRPIKEMSYELQGVLERSDTALSDKNPSRTDESQAGISGLPPKYAQKRIS